jgi:penicillin-binding protein 2
MTEIRDLESELGRFRGRLLAAAAFVLLAFGLLGARLVYLQVIRHDDLSTQAEANRIAVVPIVPNRGLIVDRNGVVLATNYSAYTLEITPRACGGAAGAADRRAVQGGRHHAARPQALQALLEESKSFESLPIRTRLTDDEVARFTAQRFRFPGVDVKARLFRSYPLGERQPPAGLHRPHQPAPRRRRWRTGPTRTRPTTRAPSTSASWGWSRPTRRELHGSTGFEEVETSAGGRAVRRLDSHAADAGQQAGAVGRHQAAGAGGAAVRRPPRRAGGTGPAHGEVLAFVSKPTFDPNLFVDGIDSDSWRELNESIDKPLLNRALRGTYPPGSTYKPFMAMAALNTGKRSPAVINDGGSFMFGNHPSAATATRAGAGGHAPRDRQVEQRLLLLAGQRDGRGPDPRQLSPGLRPQDRHRRRRRAHRRAAVHRVEAAPTRSPSSSAGTPARPSRWASARATTTSPCCSWPAPPPRWSRRPALQAAAGARDRGRAHRPAPRVAGDALEPLPLKPEHVEVIRKALQGVTQEGTSARVFAGRGLPQRRQDRHGAGGGRIAPTRSTTPPSWRSTSATTRCTSPPRRSRRPRWRWR